MVADVGQVTDISVREWSPSAVASCMVLAAGRLERPVADIHRNSATEYQLAASADLNTFAVGGMQKVCLPGRGIAGTAGQDRDYCLESATVELVIEPFAGPLHPVHVDWQWVDLGLT